MVIDGESFAIAGSTMTLSAEEVDAIGEVTLAEEEADTGVAITLADVEVDTGGADADLQAVEVDDDNDRLTGGTGVLYNRSSSSAPSSSEKSRR